MDQPSPEKLLEIVTLVFPDLRYGGDPDIERYFELRKAGRLSQALAVYNGALRIRYNNDSSRILLLKLYRESDPRYTTYQQSLLLDFAARLSARIRSNIDLIVVPLERADLSDALRALKAVESVLTRLPGDTEGALDILSRYDRFAGILGHRELLVRRALDLVREYDAVSRADASSGYDFIARSAAIEERRRAGERARGPRSAGAEDESYDFVSRSASLERRRQSEARSPRSYFDPDRIKFSEVDKALVEISPALRRREDKVLAFCAKYWPSSRDPAFERIVFLYSRKFGGRHFEIFRTIKLGRARGATDDEILSAVSGILTTSYDYSVSGDLYMQIMWRRLRARMEAQEVAERLASPGPESRVRSRESPAAARKPHSPSRERVAPREAAAVRPAALAKRGPAAEATRAKSPKAAPARPLPPMPKSAVPRALGLHAAEAPHEAAVARPAALTRRNPAAEATRAQPPMPAPAPDTSAALSPVKAKGTKLLGRAPAGPEPIREIKAKGGSISDSIRKLSGRTYDVYKEIFLEKVRDHIHRALLASQTKSHGIFDTAANEAEDQVFGFIWAHYDDPFMDWERSAEREAVEALGFSMPSLLPIIESCFKKL